MATMKLTNQEQVEDFVRGCTLYATGGGGLPENGIVSLMSEIEKNGSVGWTDVAEIPDDVLAVCPFLMGSIAPHDEYTIKEMEGFGYTEGVNKEKERLAKAIQELEDYTGKTWSRGTYRTCGSQYFGTCISGQFPGHACRRWRLLRKGNS
ncbi:MAG: DUF917 family protein [[Clostridium] scindens]